MYWIGWSWRTRSFLASEYSLFSLSRIDATAAPFATAHPPLGADTLVAEYLDGWKTQDLSTSATGSGGYRHLQFDDTPGQSRVQLYTTDHDSGLTLGHLKQNKDNKRLADRGYGVELHTQAQGALRAGTGLLLTTEPADQQMQAKGLLKTSGSTPLHDPVPTSNGSNAPTAPPLD
ncbi:Putative type VI secretion system Rhs element Vgr [Pseudomonas libanensis]|uniref:type VI secretion system Vgr family protein n=1 Tax=Pseudomonas libanensis TaxID=75588 RepID=UPI000879453D|nr:type VI secretion system Vgr family protein [Pseudomonas libanensis]SDK82623.1 Putative type VI secretion system Rhs element Vgr [Pseudomonas libanensis]